MSSIRLVVSQGVSHCSDFRIIIDLLFLVHLLLLLLFITNTPLCFLIGGEVEEAWRGHVMLIMDDSCCQHAVHSFYLFSRLYKEVRRACANLTREACQYLTTEVSVKQLRSIEDDEVAALSGIHRALLTRRISTLFSGIAPFSVHSDSKHVRTAHVSSRVSSRFRGRPDSVKLRSSRKTQISRFGNSRSLRNATSQKRTNAPSFRQVGCIFRFPCL